MASFSQSQHDHVGQVGQVGKDTPKDGFSRRTFFKGAAVFGIGAGSAGALLAACGQQPAGTVSLNLIMHVNAPANQGIQTLNTAFHQKYPNITVNISTAQTLDYPTLQSTRLAAKDVDIVEVASFTGAPTSYASGAQKPTWQQQIDGGNYIDLTGQSFLSSFSPSAIQNTSTYNGKVYSVPTGTAPFTGVFYNKAVFQQYQLQVPDTWSELLSVCQTLQSKGVTPFTLGQKDSWPAGLPTQAVLAALYPNLSGFDQGLWGGSVKYTDSAFVEVLQRVQQIWEYTEKGFGGISYATEPARFAAGKAAMMADGLWTAPAIQQAAPSLDLGYFPLPGSDSATDNNFLAGKYDISWAIAASSKNQEAALKWLAFYSEPANYSKFINTDGLVPAQPNTPTTPFLASIAQWTDTMRLSPDQVLHQKQNASKYANIIPVGSNPAPTAYLTPLGTISSPAALAQQMQTDWDDASS